MKKNVSALLAVVAVCQLLLLTISCQHEASPLSSFEKEASLSTNTSDFVLIRDGKFNFQEESFTLKGFNYYPRNYGWSDMTEWDWEEVAQELAAAGELGANTVRTFIDYGYSTGNPNLDQEVLEKFQPTSQYIEAMQKFLSIASKNNLHVIFTLFEWIPGWAFIEQSRFDIAQKYLTTLITPFKQDKRILAWDLHNEGDLLVKKFGTPFSQVLVFYQAIHKHIRSLDQNHLLTIGFGNIENAHLASHLTDFLSFHYYEDPKLLGQKIERLKKKVGANTPIILGETGRASLETNNPSRKTQSDFLEQYINTALFEKKLAGLLIWVLADFNQPKASFSHAHKGGPAADDLMANFGLLDQSLNPKPSYSLVQKLFR